MMSPASPRGCWARNKADSNKVVGREASNQASRATGRVLSKGRNRDSKAGSSREANSRDLSARRWFVRLRASGTCSSL